MTPMIGDFGLVPINNWAGKAIRIGQWLNGDGYQNYEHAFVFVGDGIVQAQPGGAVYQPRTVFSNEVLWSTGHIALTAAQRSAIRQAALHYVGTPYSVVDYFAIAAERFKIRPPFLKRYVADTGHMICSQLVDQAYNDAGVHLFTDGRWPGDVTPADLVHLIR